MNRIGLTLVAAALAMTSSVAAQNLPGPAGGGWFVLMGVNPMGGETHGTGAGAYYVPHCTAVVLPLSRVDGAHIGSLQLSKRFGPYSRREEGLGALTGSGWQCRTIEADVCAECAGYICTAEVGCQ